MFRTRYESNGCQESISGATRPDGCVFGRNALFRRSVPNLKSGSVVAWPDLASDNMQVCIPWDPNAVASFLHEL